MKIFIVLGFTLMGFFQGKCVVFNIGMSVHILLLLFDYDYFSLKPNNWYQRKLSLCMINLHERRVPSSSGSNGGRRKV